VAQLQGDLSAIGYSINDADGITISDIYDDPTQTAVERFRIAGPDRRLSPGDRSRHACKRLRIAAKHTEVVLSFLPQQRVSPL
jgi:hypothetical protein